ncbi:MAG TPA: Maf family protein [Ilumatobacteraceae bacterium]|nr:Maf family protein [Ilumatobacteraceae bacterium]
MTVVDLQGRRLVLASASPRRSELLGSVGLAFDVMPADIDESVHAGESPSEYVARLSLEKAAGIAERIDGDAIIVAADTTVDVDGQILEKPVDDDDARRMLRLLSGREHLVHTGVTVSWFPETRARGTAQGSRTCVVETAVRFVELSDHSIAWYLSTGEHTGKAGAYGIQGAAGAFVERIDGSVTNVIGLPLAETIALLRVAGPTAGD